ncbi:putative uncharacterized protein YDR544C [Penaeus monodon]|uniref:putative uncharacterized protein YDR544C n=1 Tax=Penaeus monodon TaxID=6687 RepID=UPI0018A7802D|nr:putative uncharacterized protein YDR544C [Penaeus monodon]
MNSQHPLAIIESTTLLVALHLLPSTDSFHTLYRTRPNNSFPHPHANIHTHHCPCLNTPSPPIPQTSTTLPCIRHCPPTGPSLSFPESPAVYPSTIPRALPCPQSKAPYAVHCPLNNTASHPRLITLSVPATAQPPVFSHFCLAQL